MMDATWTAVIRLYKQGLKPKVISDRLHLSAPKVKRILITSGLYSTPRTEEIAAMRRQGMTVEQIAEELGITVAAVQAHLPYIKGHYMAEYPTINALRIRRSREKKSKGDNTK